MRSMKFYICFWKKDYIYNIKTLDLLVLRTSTPRVLKSRTRNSKIPHDYSLVLIAIPHMLDALGTHFPFNKYSSSSFIFFPCILRRLLFHPFRTSFFYINLWNSAVPRTCFEWRTSHLEAWNGRHFVSECSTEVDKSIFCASCKKPLLWRSRQSFKFGIGILMDFVLKWISSGMHRESGIFCRFLFNILNAFASEYMRDHRKIHIAENSVKLLYWGDCLRYMSTCSIT